MTLIYSSGTFAVMFVSGNAGQSSKLFVVFWHCVCPLRSVRYHYSTTLSLSLSFCLMPRGGVTYTVATNKHFHRETFGWWSQNLLSHGFSKCTGSKVKKHKRSQYTQKYMFRQRERAGERTMAYRSSKLVDQTLNSNDGMWTFRCHPMRSFCCQSN